MRTFLLLLLYCLVVTPVGLVSRLVADPMTRRTDRGDTYWIPSDPSPAR
ncbi:hypothetical protein IAG44_03945 [Streptomyces roseirectus]|uniref:Uncharacterized protein n=1 Tax=Streptomyces roseirectus TaxID=2768066 RepID=A0A7H0I7D0_9ACTN|nr:hypothetical protein [Streptomyces roseirectus]QNP68696.1 hypothetical protein IAG44_03945 [Streptomyces roseirectus]